jgi:steroid delta-isomerase-like uncharacterized protein
LQNAVFDVTKSSSKSNLTMNTTEFIRRYADAWNGHDTDAFLAVYTKEGTYSNPDTYPGIGGEALAAYLKGLWTAFPDFSVEFLSAGEIEPGLIADHWRVRGTNTGTGGNGSEPTGRSISFQGASIIRVEGDKIVSDQTYFDSKGIEKQLAAESL